MPKAQREEFERRLLALVRSQLDTMDREYPDGWEITDFVITARTYSAPEPGTPLDPWAGGPYPGWYVNAWTGGSSTRYWYDAELLRDALETTTRWHKEWLEGLTEDDENDDAEEE